MREGWKVKSLSDLLDIQNGFAFNSKQFSNDGEMPLLRIRDIKYGDGTATRYSGEYDDKYLVRAGDLLIGMDGEFECHEWKGSGALLNQRVCRLENFSTGLVPRFLYYGINKYLKDIENVTTFTTVKHISSRQIKAIEFPVPPLPEQKRIVAILDEAFAGIDTAVANTGKNLANARELFESYLSSVFCKQGEGWVKKPFGECFRLKSGDGLTSKKMIPGEFPVFGGNGIAGSHNECNLSGGNVIIGRVGALCGNARYIYGSIWLTDNAFKVNKKCLINNYFLAYLINFKNLRRYARQSAQPVISNSSLKDIEVNFPESEIEQQGIAERLDGLKEEVGRLESIYQQKLTALAELKQSLLQKAFSGELTTKKTNNPVEEALA